MAARMPQRSGFSSTSRDNEDRYVGPFKRLESIGKGSFAVVYKGIHPENGSLVAIKSVQHTQLKGKLRTNLLSEIEIVKKAHHPHIVGLLDVLETPQNIHLIMEFCQLGDLASFVKKRDKLGVHPVTADMIRNYPNPACGGFNEVIVRHFAKQLASALAYLVDRKLIHRDLKPQNLLLIAPTSWLERELPENRPYQIRENPLIPKVGIDSMPCLKIADFGFARYLPQTTLAETLCGSPLYMAPEILRYERYDNKIDLWSVGIVMFELAVGKPPFRANNHVELLRKIDLNKDEIRFPSDNTISSDMKVIIRALLKRQPTERISWEGFFASGVIAKDIPGLVASDRPKKKDIVRELVREDKGDIVHESHHVTDREDARRPSQRRVSSDYAVAETKTNNAGEGLALRTRQYSSSSNQASRGTPPSPASLQRLPTSVAVHQTRPVLTSHATAPALQITRPIPGHSEGQRRRSQYSGAPDLYAIRDVSERAEREDVTQRQHDRAAREADEKAAQEIAFEREYVVVEKRQVEVNALADELDATQIRGTYPTRRGAPPSSSLLRRATTQGSSPVLPSSSAPASTQLALRSDASHQRQQSYERRYGPGKGISATSALAAALNLVNFRIHGVPTLPAFGNISPPKQLPFPAYPTFPVTANAFALLNEAKPKMTKDQEVLERAREGANRCDVVFSYAEIKYMQLIPIVPSAENNPQQTTGEGTENARTPSTAATVASSRDASPSNNAASTTPADTALVRRQGPISEEERNEPEETTLPPVAVVQISEEALLLYVKALQILDNVMDLCGAWYRMNSAGRVIGEVDESNEGPTLSGSEELRESNLVFVLEAAKNLTIESDDVDNTTFVRTSSSSTSTSAVPASSDSTNTKANPDDAAERERRSAEAHNKTLKGIKQVMKWARARWNETLLRAEYCQRKFDAARKLVPDTHLAHPSHDRPSLDGSFQISKDITAEDLLYWHARDMCKSSCFTEVPFGVPSSVLKEQMVYYKSAVRMWEAILECEGATWKEVKDESEKRKEAIRKAKPGEEVKVTWRTYNDPEVIKQVDIDRIIELLHSTHMRMQFLQAKIGMREEEEEARRGNAPRVA